MKLKSGQVLIPMRLQIVGGSVSKESKQSVVSNAQWHTGSHTWLVKMAIGTIMVNPINSFQVLKIYTTLNLLLPL